MLHRATPFLLTFVFATMLLANPVSAESEPNPKSFGISVRFIPDHARPGDVVQLRAEMDRETWGQFDLHVPANSAMHAITVEKMPLKYEHGRYQQRQSLVFQPKSSGSIVVTGARLDMVTSRGRHTVAVPDLTLKIESIENADTSNTPIPLPATERPRPATSPLAWAALFVLGSVLLLVIFLAMRKHQNRQSTAVNTTPPDSSSDDLVRALQSGELPRHELERLLNAPDFSASAAVRDAIERAVYSENVDTTELAKLLQQQEAT